MSKLMLVDAVHDQETRVVIADNDQIEDFDFITSAKNQIKGNIYLAKITRVEPSLQAAFVEYGGGKQGFLPFSEIHPDYYQIPIEDKEKLIAEEEEEARAQEEAEEAEEENPKSRRRGRRRKKPHKKAEENAESDDQEDKTDEQADGDVKAAKSESFETSSDKVNDEDDADDEDDSDDEAETVSADEVEETQEKRGGRSRIKRYRIQEVIKRNQIVLVQVIKEERGNKGVSLTTYMSLAGRYCVLMPNSPKAGGVSRKIGNGEQRKKLKEVVAELKEKRGLSVIVRTAGIDRTRTEIKRDYDYLVKLWNQIREDTLKSTAPEMIYEESNIIKRSIRDMYSSDVEHVYVHGEKAYKEAKAFMKMLMPSHAPRVKQYKENKPLFAEYGVEAQLATMYEPNAKLPSGGSIVLQQTEALISIDVNSGRSTTERNVEETAIKTNLEAAKEVARQLRLRDLAGLVVIDFIDMYYGKNRRNLERAMREALKHDRAKIQMSRISPFGLMELSRQRLRPSIAESSTTICPHCQGSGFIRSVETVAIQIIRILEREAATEEFRRIKVQTYSDVVLHILNEKRDMLDKLESDYDIEILFEIDTSMITGQHRILKTTEDGKELVHREEGNNNNKRRSRRGKRGGSSRNRDESDNNNSDDDDTNDSSNHNAKPSRGNAKRKPRQSDDDDNQNDVDSNDRTDSNDDDESKPKRRRRTRGGKGRKPRNKPSPDTYETKGDAEPQPAEQNADDKVVDIDKPKKKQAAKKEASEDSVDKKPKPAARRRKPAAKKDDAKTEENKAPVNDSSDDDDRPKRKGWWNR